LASWALSWSILAVSLAWTAWNIANANLFQLPADGLRGLAGRLKLRLGLRFLRRGQIQVLGDARAAIVPAMLLHAGGAGWLFTS
jgi:hypothetical protein